VKSAAVDEEGSAGEGGREGGRRRRGPAFLNYVSKITTYSSLFNNIVVAYYYCCVLV